MRTQPDLPLNEAHSFVGPFPSGASAITISSAARLGWHCAFFGVLGRDAFADVLLNRLTADGVDLRGVVQDPGLFTGVAFVSYNSDGSRNFIYCMPQHDKIAAQMYDKVTNFNAWEQVDWLYINGATLASSDDHRKVCAYAVEQAISNGSKFCFDPNIRTELGNAAEIRELCRPFIEKATLFLPNEAEIRSLFQMDLESSLTEALKLGPQVVGIKMGANGCLLASTKAIEKVDGFQVECIDPTGAGDIYNAACLVGYSKGFNLKNIGLFANAVAALSTKKQGPMEGCPTLVELKQFFVDQSLDQLWELLIRNTLS